MIGDICRATGVACLMNGDVRNRDEALGLVEEYGVDGAMIATAAEANSSAFRTRTEGGLLPWQEVVKEYVKTAIEVDNRWGNTKFLLSQLMPGKFPLYTKVTQAKNYTQICEILEYEDFYDKARDLDERLGLTILSGKALRKAMNKKNESVKAAGAARKKSGAAAPEKICLRKE